MPIRSEWDVLIAHMNVCIYLFSCIAIQHSESEVSYMVSISPPAHSLIRVVKRHSIWPM